MKKWCAVLLAAAVLIQTSAFANAKETTPDTTEKSREECLVEFKIAFGNSFKAVDGILHTYCPDMDEIARQEFLYAFFPFIYGLYPYTNVTEKQSNAMKEAGIDYVYYSVYELAYNFLNNLLK